MLSEFLPNILAVEAIHAIGISEGVAEFIAIVMASILIVLLKMGFDKLSKIKNSYGALRLLFLSNSRFLFLNDSCAIETTRQIGEVFIKLGLSFLSKNFET